MVKDQNLMDHQAMTGGSTPPAYPGVKLTPIGNLPPYPDVDTAGVNPNNAGYPVQPPNPGFKPDISGQSHPGAINDPGPADADVMSRYVADLGEDGEMKAFDFTDKSIRKSFIRKVYGILMTQLLITMAIVAWFSFHQPTRLWLRENRKVLYYSCLAPMFVLLVVMACSEDARRKFPMNFIMLKIFTICMSISLGCITSLFQTHTVLMAVGITAAVCLSLTLFAFQTKWDFTGLGAVLWVSLTVLLIFGLISVGFRSTNATLSTLYASLGAILFSFYLIYDTQLIMGGEHKYSITPEEYIFAALTLYLDVINLFIYILRMLGNR